MGADRCRASGETRDRPRQRGCGEGQSRPVEGHEETSFIIEPGTGFFASSLDAPVRKAQSAPDAPPALWIGARVCRFIPSLGAVVPLVALPMISDSCYLTQNRSPERACGFDSLHRH